MDNITHSAVGALFTETIYQRLPEKIKKIPSLRRNLHITSALASNLPDFDLLMQFIDSSMLGYMVNHRGHTHTAGGMFLQFFLLLGLSFFLLNKKNKEGEPSLILKPLSLVVAFGVLSHVCLDFMNSYGVHPFWPFNSKWYYGDLIYIIEPFLWITSAISFLFIIKKRSIFKYLFLTLALSSPIIFTSLGRSSWGNTLFIAVISGLMLLHFRSLSYKKIAPTGLAFILSFICIFTIQSRSSKKYIMSNSQQISNGNFVDLVTTAFPGNFFCWQFLISFTENENYKVFSGVYSPFKSILPSCPTGIRKKGLSVTSNNLKNTDHINFDGVFSMKLKTLQQIYTKNCKTKAWFSYSRTPFFRDNVLHDLRYSNKSDKSFARLDLNDTSVSCPVMESPWIPPRKNILLTD